MCLLKIRCLLLIICKCLVITTSYAAVKNSVPRSPCPSVLEYEIDNNNNLHGYIATSAPTSYTNHITLDVQLSVENRVQGSTGNIVLLNSRITEDVLQNRLLLYKLEFPYWQNIPPQITQIFMNGNIICFGQPLNFPGMITINIQNVQPLTVRPPLSRTPNFAESPNSETGTGTFNLNQRTQEAPHTTSLEVLEVWQPPKVPQRPQNQIQLYPDTVRPTLEMSPPEVLEVWKSPNQIMISSSKPNQDVSHRPQNLIPVQRATARPTLPTSSTVKPEVWQQPTEKSNRIRIPFLNVCGLSNVTTVQLVIHGNKNVASGAHPWVAALFKQSDDGLRFTCGCTIISKWHVVTAAHCVKYSHATPKAEDFWIVLGRLNIMKWSGDGAQIIQAEATYPHPEFKFNTGDADIAVIRLRQQVNFTMLIKPICLWTSDNDQKLIIKKKGTVIGWGKDETGKAYTAEPSQLSFPVVSEEECLRSNFGFKDISSKRTFCAGYRNNSGPCTGDSGSGFYMKQNGRWSFRGIVSTALSGGDKNCDVTEYIVFADAAMFTEWLLTFLN